MGRRPFSPSPTTAGRAAIVAAFMAALALPAHAGLLGSLSHLLGRTEAAHPNALWHIVHGLCLRTMKVSGQPAPCAKVDLAGGYAVLRDVPGKTQVLVIPTARITGIEGPELEAPDSPNYWQGAWSARDLVGQQIGRPLRREEVGLAINSVFGRTQNQLHIHVDCIQPAVPRLLRAQLREIHGHWAPLGVRLMGRRYKALWVAGEDLGANDPFKLLAKGDALARKDMARETLAVVGMVRDDGKPGFVVLSGRASLAENNPGAAEALLDHKCGILSDAGKPG